MPNELLLSSEIDAFEVGEAEKVSKIPKKHRKIRKKMYHFFGQKIIEKSILPIFCIFSKKRINGKFDDVEKLVLLMVFFDNKFVGNKKDV